MSHGITIKEDGTTTREYRNLEGMRFQYLEVIRKNGTRGRNVLWRCYCHACGSEKDVIGAQLRKHTKSCGCRRRMREHTSPYWKGVGEISRTILGYLHGNCKRRGIEYRVSDQYIWELFLKQERKCALSGLPLQFGRAGRDNITASLDRVDSTKPYVEGNVQWVHKHINMMKLDHPQPYFLELCRLVTEINSNK